MIRHVIIKVSGACNLACSYCYYMTARDQALQVPMPEHVMAATLRGLARYARRQDPPLAAVSLYWHGGEPLLRNLDFWRSVVRLQQDTAAGGFSWDNRITTNATLVDDDIAAFFGTHRWTVNVSIDGPRAQHDAERVDHLGRGSYAQVLEGFERLRHAGLQPTVFTVVRDQEGSGAALYAHHKALGVTSCELHLPFYNWTTEPDADRKSESVLREVMAFYDAWQADGRVMQVRLFDTVFSKLRHGQHLVCHHVDRCNEVVTIEPNGDVFLCDDLLGMDYRGSKLGLNVLMTNFQRVASAVDHAIGTAQLAAKSPDCRACDIFDICGGGCAATRWDGTSYANRSAHCGVFKGLFSAIKDEWEEREATFAGRLARSLASAAAQ